MRPRIMDFLKMFTSKKQKDEDKYTKDEHIRVLRRRITKLQTLLDISEAQKEHLKQQIQEYKARELNNITKNT